MSGIADEILRDIFLANHLTILFCQYFVIWLHSVFKTEEMIAFKNVHILKKYFALLEYFESSLNSPFF